VVSVATTPQTHVKGDPRCGHKGAKELFGELWIKSRVSEAWRVGRKGDFEHKKGSSGNIEGHLDGGLVKGNQAGGKAGNPHFLSESFADDFAQDDPDVFDGVVSVDLEIAVGLDRQINVAVPAYLLEHVIEEWDARRNLDDTRPIEVDPNLDGGLFRLPDLPSAS
jgi:hypothetical protein